MKRLFLLALIVVLVFILPLIALASIGVEIDGNEYLFDPPPIIQDSRTLVPMRSFFEALGATVDWETETQTAVGTRGDVTVRIPIGSTSPTINGRVETIQVAAQIIGGRTYIPLRFVGEALGDGVQWEGTTRTISITKKDTTLSAPKVPSPPPIKDLSVHFLDVGQGDAILVQSPSGMNMLIDGGPRTAGQKVVSYLKQAGISSIDLIISTHPHEDHIGGLISVLQEFPVKEVIDPGIVHTTKTFEDYLTLIDQKDIKFTEGRIGMSRDLGAGTRLEILHPFSPSSSHLNDASIVAKLTYNQVSFLFTGDAEEASERQMLAQSQVQPTSTILKVGHHGSRTSTSTAFLNAVDPEVAVIMCGADNRYGHPHEEVLQRLAGTGISIYRTDLHGDIVVTTDGQTYEINVKHSYQHTPQKVPEEPESGSAVAEGKFVGSIKSDKYHYPTCRHAESINPENEIWFENVQDAKGKGYTPCGVCRPPQ